MKINKKIGENVCRLREARGQSQQELGAAFGKSKYTVLRIENGKTSTKVEDLEAIAEELGVPVSQLTADEADPFFISVSKIKRAHPSKDVISSLLDQISRLKPGHIEALKAFIEKLR